MKFTLNEIAAGEQRRSLSPPLSPNQPLLCVPVLWFLRAMLPVLSLSGCICRAVSCHQLIFTTQSLPQAPQTLPSPPPYLAATRSTLHPVAVYLLCVLLVCLLQEPEYHRLAHLPRVILGQPWVVSSVPFVEEQTSLITSTGSHSWDSDLTLDSMNVIQRQRTLPLGRNKELRSLGRVLHVRALCCTNMKIWVHIL